MRKWPTDGIFRVRLDRQDLSFSAAHISTYGDLMEGQHGHNYQLCVDLEGPLGEDALVVDFRSVKRILKSISEELNHRMLVPALNPGLTIEHSDQSTKIAFGEEYIELSTSSLVLLDVPNVTAEMLAYYFFQEIKARLPQQDRQRLQRLTVEIIESPGQSSSFSALLNPES